MSSHPPAVIRLDDLSTHASTQVISSIFVELESLYSATVRCRIALSELDGMQFIRTATHGGKCQVCRHEQHIKESASHFIFACLPLRHDIAIVQEGRSCILGRGDLGLLDSRSEYAIDIPDSSDTLWVRVAPAGLDARFRDAADATARRVDGSKGLGLIASRFVHSMASQADAMRVPSMAPLGSIMMDLVSAAVSGELASLPLKRRSTGERTLERAHHYIERHLEDEALSPAQIAAGIGISTRYLSELFAVNGESAMDRVKQRRLGQCFAALKDQPWKPGLITEIAYKYGFANVSSFNRSFKEAFGRPPKDFMLRRYSSDIQRVRVGA